MLVAVGLADTGLAEAGALAAGSGAGAYALTLDDGGAVGWASCAAARFSEAFFAGSWALLSLWLLSFRGALEALAVLAAGLLGACVCFGALAGAFGGGFACAFGSAFGAAFDAAFGETFVCVLGVDGPVVLAGAVLWAPAAGCAVLADGLLTERPPPPFSGARV